jgi:uncharacterized RDD family membrane protein YckC
MIDAPFAAVLPSGVQVSSKGRRLLAALLDGLLATVTLGIGWAIWALIVHKEATTPGKKLMGMRVVRTDTGQATTWGYTFLREWIVKGIIGSITFGISYLWILWDRNYQTLHDKVLNTVVVDDPRGLTLAANRLPAPTQQMTA